jgi:glycosyltransferase involved in cell wall biosynthesis
LILFVSEFVENQRKGFGHLQQALKLLENQSVGVPYSLMIVGKGKPDLTGIRVPVHHFGSIRSETEMAKMYAAADLFVIPSEQDNMPNTIVESLSCGTPTVGFAVGGIPELINQPELGMLSQRISEEELANTIGRALETTFDRNKIRAIAEKRFAPEVQAKGYYELYLDLLES